MTGWLFLSGWVGLVLLVGWLRASGKITKPRARKQLQVLIPRCFTNRKLFFNIATWTLVPTFYYAKKPKIINLSLIMLLVASSTPGQ